MAEKITTHRELEVYQRAFDSAFVSKIAECEGEAAETQVWIEFAVQSGYLAREAGRDLYRSYDQILTTLVGVVIHADKWTFPTKKR